MVDFTLQDQNGDEHTLSDYKGKKVVIYFYPKDDTPGCTKQACAIRDDYSKIQEKAVIFGISPDDVASHKKFEQKYNLPFTLLADTEHKVAELFDVWVEKSMYGRKFWGAQRSTFIIDEDGNIAHEFRKVKPLEHFDLVMSHL